MRSWDEPGRGVRGRLATALAAALLLAALPLDAQRLALLPTENLSAAVGAPSLVAPLLQHELEARGWEVVVGPEVERALAGARVRRLDSLPAGARERLTGQLSVDAFAASTVLAFRTEGIPLAALALRLVAADGRELFAEAAALSAEDTRGPLDRETRDSIGPLTELAVERLCRELPPPGGSAARRSPAGAPMGVGAPATYRSADLDALPAPRRVAVLPFRNVTRERDAGRIATQLAAGWLGRADGFAAVEAADLREALIAENVRDAYVIEPERLRAVGRRVGTDLFLRGTVYAWKPEPPAGSDVAPPEVELHFRLVDVEASRVLWASHLHRRGDEYRRLLGLGVVSNVVALADRALGEMSAAKGVRRPARPSGAPAPTAGAPPSEETAPQESSATVPESQPPASAPPAPGGRGS